MPQEHYFSSKPADRAALRTVPVRLAGRDLEVQTAGGVFSPDHVDLGTRVLLDEVPAAPTSGHLLDLGAGWGPIALTLGLQSPEATVWAVDVNERALDLVRGNASRLRLVNVNAAMPDDVPDDVRFSTIWSNPPIRIGKAELHAVLRRWVPRLETGGTAWLVVQKNLGSDSLQRWIAEEFGAGWTVERAATSKGFRVLAVTRDA
ncbi:MFS transporter [Agromyces luteolus]|uniref:Methyltransferase n=1 Tax=Agromyces luteolus TaxID=88373 RepID=A0A7C9LDW8_9MICO|nr:methyltransferase [Agromyces luteolus]MUN07451.1 methyltransferase [Agromyces luteolus]GLK29344.1 MFS transporter [Agromyces luteolus]